MKNESDNVLKSDQNSISNNSRFETNSNPLFFFSDGSLKFLNSQNGKEKWQIETGGELAAEPLIQGGGIFIVIKPLVKHPSLSYLQKIPYSLRFINKETGITEWAKTFYNEGDVYLHGFNNNIFLINQKSQIFAFDQKNGETIWEKSYLGQLSSAPFFFDDKALLPKPDGFILVSLIDGGIIRQEKNFKAKLNSLSANGETFFFGDERGLIQGLETTSKKGKWKYRVGGAVSSINYHEGFILATSLDNFIYYFSSENGKLIWKKRAAGRIVSEPLVFNQTALILVEGSTNVLFIDLSDGKVFNQLNFPEDTYFTGNPKKIDEFLVFPTQKKLIAYSLGQCP
ncbi:MAG TPA: PQQ-binding-like beta-propeller repeat protein [Pyrinomonadaceae bacterium]|nr:PQQ-binding-like beta-propeller repeat protein [Pyrinomonadaceae bacterium]